MRGAILIGGKSSRFGGRPKGLEVVGGVRMLDRAVGAMAEAVGAAPMLVGSHPDAASWRADLEFVPDALPESGTLVGLYSALLAAGGPVTILAWDMPFVPAGLLAALIEGSAGSDVFLPESEGPRGLEPLCGVYRPPCLEPMRHALAAGDLSAVGFHEAVRVGTLPLTAVSRFGAPARLFFNVNSRSDLERAEGLWQPHG